MQSVHQEQSMLIDKKLSGLQDWQLQRNQLTFTLPLSIEDIDKTFASV